MVPTESASLLSVGILVVGLGFAGACDLQRREVPDWVWQLLGAVGAALGFLVIGSGSGALGVGLWALTSAFVLQHFFDWETAVEQRSVALLTGVEVALYAVTIAIVVVASLAYGLGAPGVPLFVPAAIGSTVVARLLFESRALWGGADAKALMTMGLLVPLLTVTALPLPTTAAALLAVSPFALNALVNGLLLSVAVPIALALRNLSRREFTWASGFTTYTLPTDALPDRFVWVHDPRLPEEAAPDLVESAEDDADHRREMTATLRDRGISSLRVSPQLPIVAFLAAGSIVTLIAGNLLWDLAVVL